MSTQPPRNARSLFGANPRHVVAAVVRHPDIGTVEGDPLGVCCHGVGAHGGSSGGQQLRHVVAAVVHHPDIGTVEGDANGAASHGVGAHCGSSRQIGRASC